MLKAIPKDGEYYHIWQKGGPNREKPNIKEKKK